MGRFTLPRDLYYGKDSLEFLKNIDGKKAIVVSGGSSYRRGGFLDIVEAYLKEAGMMGVEVYYSSHSQSDRLHLREIASRLGLVSTGGSDFHGAIKPDIHLGSGYGGLRVSALLLDNIKARLQQKNS